MKFILECLNHHHPTLELTTTKATLLGPGLVQVPLSRIEAYPDYKNGKVRFKNLGRIKGLLNFERVIKKGDEVSGIPGDIIDLTVATYLYKIREISDISQPQEPLRAHEKKNRLEIELKPQLSMIVSEDISSTMIASDDGSESVASGSSIQSKSKKLDWQSFSGTLGALPVLVYGENILKSKPKVAAFDLDGTIIKPEPGMWKALKGTSAFKRSISKEMSSAWRSGLWKFAYDDVKDVLRQFFQTHSDHKFLIVTNKANVSFEVSKLIIEEVVLELDIPVVVFAAREATQFLKPSPCCWEVYRKHFNEGVDPKWGESFFCGDSAGRTGDLSKCDRLFALNKGMGFKTPEAFFQSKKDDERLFQMPTFIPKDVVEATLNNDHIKFPHEQEIIVMCGGPKSGKTAFVETTLAAKDYCLILLNSKMSTLKKQIEAAEKALSSGLNVVIDKRNTDIDERMTWIRMAQALHIHIRCFLMNVGPEQSLHNFRFHELRTGKICNSSEVELGMKRFKALYEHPTIDEGFSEIVSVNFVPQTVLHRSHSELILYSKFLIPK